MAKTVIQTLCDEINKARRVKYPERGYLMFSDIKGDGRNRKRVYMVINDKGGVAAMHNGSYRQTAKNLRNVLAEQNIF